MGKQRPKKVRIAFRKNRENRVRSQRFPQESLDSLADDTSTTSERISGKGRLTRHRTILSVAEDGGTVQRAVDESACRVGRVLRAIGSNRCDVLDVEGRIVTCTVRRVLRSLFRETRSAVVAGDEVLFQDVGNGEGVIERVESRRTVFSRGTGRYEHVIAANIDQLLIVASAAAPPLKRALIDRFLISAAKGGLQPIICINKIDLIDQEDLRPAIELYTGLGYPVISAAATSGIGIDELRARLAHRETAVGGQSGVGKSSLLNAVQPGLGLRTSHVSEDSGKGRHTTRVAERIPLAGGGWIIDTPGIRQMELWDVGRGEIEGFFVEFLPLVADCRFPDCTHTHESGCRIKEAVAAGEISPLRYESYCRLFSGD